MNQHRLKSIRAPVTALLSLLALGFLALAVPPATAWAQGQVQTGAVSGTVLNEQGAPLAGAQLVLEEIGKGTLSRANGDYALREVPVGTYTLRVTYIGYRSQAQTVTVRVFVQAGDEVIQNFTLPIDPLGLEAIVVTATRTPRVKLESSSAITTLSSREIEQEEPVSTADLMKSIPGFYVEASGGEVNNNLFVRGLPADGSYRYVIFMEDGMPANDGNDFFFLGADNFIRVDENIDRVEAVRGGNSALFGSNAAGGVVNLINKTGGPSLSGSAKATYGTDDYTRFDFNLNGPLAEDWRFNAGGYYRFDEGIRDPGFPAARGGQLKASVTRLWDRGYVRVSGKYINDKNVFYLPLPVRSEPTGEDRTLKGVGDTPDETLPVVELTSDFYGGFPSDGTMGSREGAFRKVPLPRGNGELSLPLEDGIAQIGRTVMADIGIDFPNDWSVRNTVRVMNLDHQWNAMLPNEIVNADDYVTGQLAETGGTSAVLRFANTALPLAASDSLLSLGGLWHVEKPVTNVSNQLIVNKTLATNDIIHNLTLGAYFGHYTANNHWFFNDILTEVADRPRLVDLIITDAGGSIVSATDNGFRAYLPFHVNAFGNATLFSFFAGDEIQLTDRLRIDIGGRFEKDVYKQDVENTSTFDLGELDNPATTADDALNFGDGTFQRVSVDFDEWAASLGVNYSVNEQISVYGRGSRGYKMPLLDQFLFATDTAAEDFPNQAETLWQVEGGVKVSSSTIGLSAVGYWLQLQDFPTQDAVIVDGATEFRTRFVGKARTLGLEAEAVVAPYEGLRLNGRVTLQDHEYSEFIEGDRDLSGNWVRRIPKVLLGLGGSFTNSGFTIGGEWNYTGKRFSNNNNTIELPAWGVINGRASYAIPGQGITLSAAVVNLLDGEGLTEGNPRLDETGAPEGPGLARPILPRRFLFAVRYDIN